MLFKNHVLKFKYQPRRLKPTSVFEDMWIYYILNVVNLLYILITVFDHLQVGVNTGDLWKVAINLYMPEYPLCHCILPFQEDSSEMFAV